VAIDHNEQNEILFGVREFMQVLCKSTNEQGDIRCKICGQAFSLYYTRTNAKERLAIHHELQLSFRDQHLGTDERHAHPENGFTVPHWDGETKFSAAALLGNAPKTAYS
jgi:hypothetical protein